MGLWTKQQERTLKRMLKQRKTFPEIAKVIGKSPTDCQSKRVRMGLPATGNMGRAGTNWRAWTETEFQRAVYLRDVKHYSMRKIAKILGRTDKAVAGKLLQKIRVRAGVTYESRESKCVPVEVLNDRERRYSIPVYDMTAIIFGDPLPGQSAYDRRAQKEAA